MRQIMLALLSGTVALAGVDSRAAAPESETVIAKSSDRARVVSAVMSIRGLTSAPPGYRAFCRRHPRECQGQSGHVRASGDNRRISLTAERWIMLMAVNSYINDRITPKTDLELYGVEERWTLPEAAGDCEDYVLLKRRELIKRGWPRSALLITVVLDENNSGHAVLTVRTAQGDFVLDNKHSRVLLWRDVPYTFIKRQSYRSPSLWVALTPREGESSVAASDTEHGAPERAR